MAMLLWGDMAQILHLALRDIEFTDPGEWTLPDWLLRRRQPDQMFEFNREEGRLRRVFYGAMFLHLLLVVFLYLVQPRLLYAFVFFQGSMLWTIVVMMYAFQRLYSVSSEVKGMLRHQSFQDQVTEVFNYRYLHLRLSEEHERTSRYGGFTSVLYVDLDKFKPVNDQFGHQTGNQVLKEVAAAMSDSMRSCDVLGRVGGDEFLVVLPQTDRRQATVLADRLRRAVESYVLDLGEGGQVDGVCASIGVAAYPVNGDTMDDVLTAADSAVYDAKEQGGNTVCVAERFVSSETHARELIEGVRASNARV